jgi:hypothetical protein
MKMSPGNERSTDAAGASTSSVTTPSVRTVMCSSSIAARAIRPSVWRTSSTWATAPITWPPAGSGTWPLTSWGPLPPVEDSLMVIVARSPLRSAVAERAVRVALPTFGGASASAGSGATADGDAVATIGVVAPTISPKIARRGRPVMAPSTPRAPDRFPRTHRAARADH